MTTDPLDQITLTPRRFGAVLAFLGLLLGLVLAMVPVGVAGPDPASGAGVTCGNVVGGVETAWVVEDLGEDYRPTTLAYLGMCERAVDARSIAAWPLLFGGLLAVVALGVVRRPGSASPGSAPPPGPAPA